MVGNPATSRACTGCRSSRPRFRDGKSFHDEVLQSVSALLAEHINKSNRQQRGTTQARQPRQAAAPPANAVPANRSNAAAVPLGSLSAGSGGDRNGNAPVPQTYGVLQLRNDMFKLVGQLSKSRGYCQFASVRGTASPSLPRSSSSRVQVA